MSTFSIELKELDELKAERKQHEALCGVYFLWDGDEIVYIGQSINVTQRLHGHFKSMGGKRRFCHYTFVPVDQEMLGITEYAYISKYKPKLNKRAW